MTQMILHREAMPSAGQRGDRPATGPQLAGRGCDAFIPYSHAVDGTLAPALQHG
jgi:hypothetical protein